MTNNNNSKNTREKRIAAREKRIAERKRRNAERRRKRRIAAREKRNAEKKRRNAAIAPNKYALIIGINYNNTSLQLNGCINDANNINAMLKGHGFQTTLITDNNPIKPTHNNIIREFRKMLRKAKPNDIVWVFYSGHGQQILDQGVKDELDGQDECIVPIDAAINSSKIINDDALNKLIANNLKPDVKLFCLFDACFSGSILDLSYSQGNSQENSTMNSKFKGSVYAISGSTDDQYSYDARQKDGNFGGMITTAFLHALNNKLVTLVEIINECRKYIQSENYTQYAVLSGSKPLHNSILLPL